MSVESPSSSPEIRSIPSVPTMLIQRWKNEDASIADQLTQIDERICDRSEQIIDFLHHVLQRDDSLNAYHGKQLLTAIGGGDVTDLQMKEMSEFAATDPSMRHVFRTIEDQVLDIKHPTVKISDYQEKITSSHNQSSFEFREMLEERIDSRINAIIHLMRSMLRSDEHFELATALRYAGGENLEKSRKKIIIQKIIKEHPYGINIFSGLEKAIGQFEVNGSTVKVNEEIAPLIMMNQEIMNGANLAHEKAA